MGIKQLSPLNKKKKSERNWWSYDTEEGYWNPEFSSYPKAREVMPGRIRGDSITWRRGNELGWPLIMKLAASPNEECH